MRIVLIGAHGSGKTTIAKKLAEKLGYDYMPIEVDGIEEKDFAEYDIEKRQQIFFEQYMEKFRKAMQKENVVMDSHPYMVVVYTYYFAMENGVKNADRLLYNMMVELMKPEYAEIDYVFFIVADPMMIKERLEKRGRKMVKEEADIRYIDSIQRMIGMFAGEYFNLIIPVINGDINEAINTILGYLEDKNKYD